VETLGLLESGGFGGLDLFGALQRRDKQHPAAPLFRRSAGDNQFQVRARRCQGRQFVRQTARSVIDDGGPSIGSAHAEFHTSPLANGSFPIQEIISHRRPFRHWKIGSFAIANEELQAALLWYEERQPDPGDNFLEMANGNENTTRALDRLATGKELCSTQSVIFKQLIDSIIAGPNAARSGLLVGGGGHSVESPANVSGKYLHTYARFP
jgi:hypothetical protein